MDRQGRRPPSSRRRHRKFIPPPGHVHALEPVPLELGRSRCLHQSFESHLGRSRPPNQSTGPLRFASPRGSTNRGLLGLSRSLRDRRARQLGGTSARAYMARFGSRIHRAVAPSAAIRDAVGRPDLYEPALFAPVIDAFVRALPHTFRAVDASVGASLQLTISGAAGGHWVVRREDSAWTLLVGEDPAAQSHIRLAAEDAWKIFTRGLRGPQARARADIRGDLTLGSRVLEMTSVIA